MSAGSDFSGWYPPINVVAEIEGQLAKLHAQQEHHSVDLASLSGDLLKWFALPGFPAYHTQRWLWLASLVRGCSNSEARRIAAAALLYCANSAAPASLTDDDVKKLRWVVDSSCRRAEAELKEKRGRLINERDANRIEVEIGRLMNASSIPYENDDVLLRKELLHKMCSPWCFPSAEKKLRRLVEVAATPDSSSARIAQTALSYVAAEDDAIPDKIGVLGLIDDVHVIEWAYASITGTTSRLPLLEAILAEWPFIEEIAFYDEQGLLTLDRYVAFVAGLVLHSLFKTNRSTQVIVRESGPLPLLSAVFATLASSRYEAGAQRTRDFASNCHIFIGDDVNRYRAVYLRPETVDGRSMHWIKVAKEGRITIDESALQFVWSTSVSHAKPLSSGNDILNWLQSRHPSALTFITGHVGRIRTGTTGVLLVSQRRRLEEIRKGLSPFGLPIGSLVDIRYVASTGAHSNFDAAATETPLVYAVSSDDVALELLKAPPSHISKWQVIVDGAQPAFQLYSAMRSAPETSDVPICVIAELHEREHCQCLAQLGLSTWLADFSDVELPADVEFDRRTTRGMLRRFSDRSAVHVTAVKCTHRLANAGFEMLDDAVQILSSSDQASAGGPLERLAIKVARFCKKAAGYPLAFDTKLREELRLAADAIRSEAQRLRFFSSEAQAIFEIFDLLITEDQLCPDRAAAIRAVVGACKQSETVAVVVSTPVVASACRAAASADPTLSVVQWCSLDDLRESAPVDRLIVATWLGRSMMREISHGGFGRSVDFVLFEFEHRWLDSTLRADGRWRRDLIAASNRQESELMAQFRRESGQSSIWLRWPPEKPELTVADRHADPDEAISGLDVLETRVADAIRSTRPIGERELVKARLLLFEQTGAYAYLPPGGRVIALSAATEAGPNAGQKAEDLLRRKIEALRPGMVVAFASASDRDLVDARADGFLKAPGTIRDNADLWRRAVRRYLGEGHTYDELSSLLANAGHGREPSTIQHWALGNSIVAPMKYTTLVPLLAELMKDQALLRSLKTTVRAIDRVYWAREQAANAIVEELFSGSIDLDADSLTFGVDGRELTFELHRIKSIEGLAEVPADCIGRVLRYDGIGQLPRAGDRQE